MKTYTEMETGETVQAAKIVAVDGKTITLDDDQIITLDGEYADKREAQTEHYYVIGPKHWWFHRPEAFEDSYDEVAE